MSTRSHIEWTDSTWNPVTGCSKISAGCAHCYAERMALRLQAMGQPKYVNGFDVCLHPDALEQPLRWRRPRRVFVNSMSDLFHRDVPDAFVERIVNVMRRAHWHTFQILTKRSERMAELSAVMTFPPNAWLGVTVERADYMWRVADLCRSTAAVRFLSLEPLPGPMDDLDLRGIDWVVLGGESGPGARPLDPSWVYAVRDRCVETEVPFFFKQWGGVRRRKAGRRLAGRTWDQLPMAALA